VYDDDDDVDEHVEPESEEASYGFSAITSFHAARNKIKLLINS